MGRAQRFRDMRPEQLHAIAWVLRSLDRGDEGMSPEQVWTFEHVVRELEYRHRRARSKGYLDCDCDVCCGPFCERKNHLGPRLAKRT